MKATGDKWKLRSRAAARLAAALCAAWFAGCGPGGADRTGEVSRGRPMRMAERAEREQNREEAIRWYELALRRRPGMALAHRRLADLFRTGPQPDIPSALYHYRKFLALAPESPDRELVEEQVDYCRQYIAERVGGENDGLTSEIDDLRDRLTAADRDRAAARAEADALREQLRAFQTAAARQVPPPPAGQGALRPPVQPPSVPPVAAGPRTHKVQNGETLAKIAAKYGTTADAILRANPGVVPGNDPRRLRVGTTLAIPPTP